MQVQAQQMRTQLQIDNVLTQVDQIIWPSTEAVDTDTKTFFVFKPYPKQLKRHQIEQWAQLQCKALSPFTGGEYYRYLSKAGLHLWVSQNNFNGLPETALQKALSNGSHIVKGTRYLYQQTWADGLLVNCMIMDQTNKPQNETIIPLEISPGSQWAVARKIDRQLKKPSTWLGISLFILLCGLIWHAAGFLTLHFQYQHAEQTAAALQEKLGEQLATQDRLQSQQSSLVRLQNWQAEYGFLPETFAAVAEKISQQGTWQANSIGWQNRTLVIELVAKELDIAKLVAALEQVNNLAKVNIRPHISENTWILEASLK